MEQTDKVHALLLMYVYYTLETVLLAIMLCSSFLFFISPFKKRCLGAHAIFQWFQELEYSWETLRSHRHFYPHTKTRQVDEVLGLAAHCCWSPFFYETKINIRYNKLVCLQMRSKSLHLSGSQEVDLPGRLPVSCDTLSGLFDFIDSAPTLSQP